MSHLQGALLQMTLRHLSGSDVQKHNVAGSPGAAFQEKDMPQYMTQFTFTPEAWKAMAGKPQNPGQTIRSIIERCGGSIITFYYSFGEFDGIVLYDAPDEVTAAAMAVATDITEPLKAIKTTVLLSEDKGREMMQKVGSLNLSQVPT